MRLRQRSHSVWPDLWKDRAQYTNPLFQAEQSQSQGVLRPNTSPYCFKMWKALYNHVDKSTPPHQSPADFLSAVREESQQLEEELTNHQEVPAGGTAHHQAAGSRQEDRRSDGETDPVDRGPGSEED
ncbi:myotubularin-related protein 7 [Austrofundulus limnaeus]|nr:PREDICTED: myotubularin-related protein 7-like [Austrofundulus limnaeus]